MKMLWKGMRGLIIVLILHGYASAGEIVDQVYKKKTFEGSKDRKYSVFLPEDQGAGSAIETHFVDGPGHVWVGGAQGTYADPDGPDWAAIAWAFFKAHPMIEQ